MLCHTNPAIPDHYQQLCWHRQTHMSSGDLFCKICGCRPSWFPWQRLCRCFETNKSKAALSLVRKSSSLFTRLVAYPWTLSILRLRLNGCHFPDDIFKCIFVHKNVWISIGISPKFVPYVPNDNKPSLVQKMAWCWPGDKSLSEPMMVSLLMPHLASMC